MIKSSEDADHYSGIAIAGCPRSLIDLVYLLVQSILLYLFSKLF